MSYQNKIFKVETPIDAICQNSVDTYNHLDDYYFAFIDVLGFKNLFDKSVEEREDGKLIYKVFNDVFAHYFNIMDSADFMDDGSKQSYTGQTSDSIYFYTKRSEFLLKYLKIFSYINIYAMSKNIFFRGGIAKGGLSFKENYQFYGDSVIKAYLLESNISKQPIVVIDKQTSEDLSFYESDYNLLIGETSQKRRYLKPFSYIKGGVKLNLRDPLLCEEVSNEEISAVLHDNMKRYEYDEKNYTKYEFLYREYEREILNGKEDENE